MISRVTSEFAARYGQPAKLVARAPGRVNLIGEHTDYSLLPVLPMAIDRSVLVAAGPGRGGLLEADSLSRPSPLATRAPFAVEKAATWHRYIAAAVATVGERSEGAQLLIGGDLPSEGGLSSSSALTVALVAALNGLWQLGFDDQGLIEAAIAAERATGVEGGMMDQTVIVRAAEGAALRVDFDPTRTRPVPIPEGLSVVAAYSGRPAPKGAGAKSAYNRLVVASRTAAALLGRGRDSGRLASLGRLALIPDISSSAADLPEAATAEIVAAETAIPTELLVELSAGEFDPAEVLPIRAAAQHAFSEANRVNEAEQALLNGEWSRFGQLLDDSQASLVALGVSTAELGRLVASMRAAGAAGSRLTGAGFGGYAIAACQPEVVPRVIEAAEQATGGPSFVVKPAGGLVTSVI
ncbi:MAG: galactokinase [Acidimicrobiia bacterium]